MVSGRSGRFVVQDVNKHIHLQLQNALVDHLAVPQCARNDRPLLMAHNRTISRDKDCRLEQQARKSTRRQPRVEPSIHGNMRTDMACAEIAYWRALDARH